MSVASTHADYDRFAPKWKRCRDCIAGQDAIHAARTAYLPKLKDESDGSSGLADDNDYAARLKRSDFFNGTWRTIAGLGGMAFRKPPTVEVPPGIEPYLEDVNMAGLTMDGLAMEALDEVLSVGRLGLLVDHPTAPENVTPLTVDAAQKLGLRPTIQTYSAESMTNWKFGRVANAWVLTEVRLKECVAIPDGEWDEKTEDRWRVLDLDAAGQYRQRLFRKKYATEQDAADFVQIGGDVYPLMAGKKLTYIPFVIVGADGRGDQIDEPPMIDLVDANLALYGINADYRHGLHFTGLPTPWIAGYVPTVEGTKLGIGSTFAWLFPDPNTTVGFLEFTGQGLDALKQARDDKKLEMAMLGARMIADETSKARETLGATQIKRQGENGVLSRIAQATSEALEWALGIFAEWAGHPAGKDSKIVYQINRDFQPALIDAPTMLANIAALQSGAMSHEELFDLWQRGDVIESDISFEEHQAKVDAQAPATPAKPAVDPAAKAA